VRRFVEPQRLARDDVFSRQHDGGACVGGDGLDPLHVAVSPGRIRGHRHHARQQATEERRHKIEPRGVEHQGPLAG
jgi:hypothetical protein